MKRKQYSIPRDTVFESFVADLRRRLERRLKRIILFGSRARGDARADSDYDCLVIVDSPDSSVESAIDHAAGEALYANNAVCSAFAVSEEEYAGNSYNPLYLNVRKEGVPV